METLRSVLPEGYKATWKGAGISCSHERFYIKVEVEVCIRVDDVRIAQQHERERLLSELDKQNTTKTLELLNWPVNAWRALAEKKEIPEFNTNFDITI